MLHTCGERMCCLYRTPAAAGCVGRRGQSHCPPSRVRWAPTCPTCSTARCRQPASLSASSTPSNQPSSSSESPTTPSHMTPDVVHAWLTWHTMTPCNPHDLLCYTHDTWLTSDHTTCTTGITKCGSHDSCVYHTWFLLSHDSHMLSTHIAYVSFAVTRCTWQDCCCHWSVPSPGCPGSVRWQHF